MEDVLKSRETGIGLCRIAGSGQMEEDRSVELNDEGVESKDWLGCGGIGAFGAVEMGVAAVLAGFLSCLESSL